MTCSTNKPNHCYLQPISLNLMAKLWTKPYRRNSQWKSKIKLPKKALKIRLVFTLKVQRWCLACVLEKCVLVECFECLCFWICPGSWLSIAHRVGDDSRAISENALFVLILLKVYFFSLKYLKSIELNWTFFCPLLFGFNFHF